MIQEVKPLAKKRSPFYSEVMQRIWGSPDAVMLIFAGSSAEFALNRSVDWLFYTNKLPSAPIERFFSTTRFAQHLFFEPAGIALATVERINQAHAGVEKSRGMKITPAAYRSVLFMLIDQGERAHAALFGPMTAAEKISHFEAALAFGRAMHIDGLPGSYENYLLQRRIQLKEDYENSAFTARLFDSYRQALGPVRYYFLRHIQTLVLPPALGELLEARPGLPGKALLRVFRFLPGKGNKLRLLHPVLLPAVFRQELKSLSDFYRRHSA